MALSQNAELDLSDPAVCHQLGRDTAQKEHQYVYTDFGTDKQSVLCACGWKPVGPNSAENMAEHVEREAVLRGAAERDACLKRIGKWAE